jgi:foldase protein PrsA
MGEGNHLPNATPQSSSFSRLWVAIAGTVTVLVAGLVLMQLFRAQPGQAAAEPAANKNTAGKKPDIVARVGRETVPYDVIAKECFDRYGKEVLDDLINRMIIQQECDAKGITVTEEEVTQEIGRISKRFNLEPAAWYQMLQAERNITPQQYRQSVIWPMLALKKLAGEQVDISEDDINKSFVRNYGPRVKARLILLDNSRRARECWEKCSQDPDNFEKYAQEYSVDPNSKALGGSVPPIPRYSGADNLENAAFKLREIGEISGLIEVGTGRYAILKYEGRTEQLINDKAEVQDSLYEELLEQKTQQSVAKVFENIKKNAQVDNYLTQTSTGPNRPFAQAPAGVQQTGGKNPAAAPVTNAAGTARPGTATTRPAANGAGTATLKGLAPR